MGPLSEFKQISLKDLGYAIENAWDLRVRRAAIALTLTRLKQALQDPAPTAGFLHVVSGRRSYAGRQIYRLTLLEGTILGGSLIGTLVYLILTILKRQQTPDGKALALLFSRSNTIIIGLIVIGLAIALGFMLGRLVNLIVNSLERQIDNYSLGKEGEDRVVEIAQQSLDGNWYLFRNVVLPGCNKGDLDGILVGPLGVWVWEIKNLNGEYRNIGDRWEYRKSRRWRPATANPSCQAEDNAICLANS